MKALITILTLLLAGTLLAEEKHLTVDEQLVIARAQISSLMAQVNSLTADLRNAPARCQSMVADQSYKKLTTSFRGDRPENCTLDTMQEWVCPEPAVKEQASKTQKGVDDGG